MKANHGRVDVSMSKLCDSHICPTPYAKDRMRAFHDQGDKPYKAPKHKILKRK